MDEWAKLLEKLNSPLDWALVLGAATLGLVVDGAINIVPIPFFSPGICGLVAGSATLSAKRGVEAVAGNTRKRRKRTIILNEIDRLCAALNENGYEIAAHNLKIDAELAQDDLSALENVLRSARSNELQVTAPAEREVYGGIAGTMLTRGLALGRFRDEDEGR